MVGAGLLKQLVEKARGVVRWRFAGFALDGGNELSPALPLVLVFPKAARGALVGRLIVLGLTTLGAVEDRPHGILAGGVVGCDVEELLGGPWALAPKLVDQGFAGGSGYEHTYDVSVCHMRWRCTP